MKTMFRKFFSGSILPLVCVSFSCFFAACNNESDVRNLEVNAFDPSRKVFSDENEFQNFIKTINETEDSDSKLNVPLSELSILDAFLYLTPFGEFVNEKYEYQIGENIHKFGKSGYTEYVFDISNYADAITTIANEGDLIKSLENYEKTEDNFYKIKEGFFVLYSGKPLVEIVDITPPKLKVSADGRTKVRVSFYSTNAIVYSECGSKVEAFELKNGSFVPYNTELRLSWNITVTGAGGYESYNGNDTSTDTSMKRRASWYSGMPVAPTYSLYRGTISGSCKCWDGQWLSATYTK